MNIKQLYNKLIIKQTDLLIIDCVGYNKAGKFNYKYKHHILSQDANKQIAQLLIDNIVFYSYSASEIENQGLLNNGLRDAATYALSERLAKRPNLKSDGLVGELMLDILIQAMHPNIEKLFTRAKYKQFADNSEITGYDAAFFLKTSDHKIELWLGQAKAGGEAYCKKDICKDLNGKFLDKYFCDVVRFMRDRGFNETTDPDLLELLNKINTIIFSSMKLAKLSDRKEYISNGIFDVLNKSNVTVTIPCLLMYNSEVYNDLTKFDKNIVEIYDKIYKFFESKNFNYTTRIPIKIVFIILPTKELNDIKQEISNFKQVVQ